jgi:predicted SnoaL-like aldol condensation-catalyzing enzyme
MAKKFVENFYKSDALIDPVVMDTFLHEDVLLDWNSSKGFLQLNKQQLMGLAAELQKAYERSKVRMSHLFSDGNLVSVRYSHYVKTIENPREEMLLAHFIVIWELKDGLLFRGYQMSQPA